MAKKIIHWAIRVIPAVIMLQTLFYKFGGSEESIHIFSTIGIEPWGRYVSGIVELIASVLLLTKKYSGVGAILGVETMMGAIFSHLAFLGIEVLGDGGYLFTLAVITLLTCAIVVFQEKVQLLGMLRKMSSQTGK